MIGDVVAARITEVGPNSLFGVLDAPAMPDRRQQPALAPAGA
jgi:hypothetical protein